MIIPDVNVLLYAYDSTSPFHVEAAAWWQGCLFRHRAGGPAARGTLRVRSRRHQPARVPGTHDAR